MQWHRRIGHASKQTLISLAEASLIPISTKELHALDTSLCQACLAGKLHRSSFPEERSRSVTTPLARIHMDIKGPLPTSIDGRKYMLVLVDEASSYVWTFPLKAKSEAAPTIKVWLLQEERQSGRSAQAFMSDYGTEFFNNAIRE